MHRSYRVAGLPVIDVSIDDAVRLIMGDVASGSAHVYALVNAYSSTLRRQDAGYRDLLEDEGTICLPDGAPLAWGASLFAGAKMRRCPGPDLFEATCAEAARSGVPVFLLGGGENVVGKLEGALTGRYPRLLVAGTATPPFGEWPDSISRELVAQVAASGARVLWLGVSAPKQEKWAARYLPELGIPVICVGAAFDFLSDTVPRAPRWMRDFGLEWLFRLGTDPVRLWKRYVIGNLVFLWDLATLRARRLPDMAKDEEQ